MHDLPGGTVTFLFTDVEGSTRLLHELGAEGYAAELAEHRRVVRDAFVTRGGVEVDTQGDAFFVAFPTAPGALEAARAAQAALAGGAIRVRMGVHTGTPFLDEEGYVGADVHRAARIAAAGHGGQVLVSASTAALTEANGLRDLGEHRLKDLSAPERIYQLGEGDFPPLKSLYRTNLPIPATPFLGRERELGEVLDLLGQSRLLTLTGPGGTGKTRLGLQAAAEDAERHPDGVFWIPLAPLADPELVLEAAAQALGAQNGLAEHVADKSLLVLFDNFEHVIGAAESLAELLAACPNLHMLVTSREVLRVPGEQAYPVPPLEPQDGAELFLARARAALPDFAATDAVPELCARLENLPLALELAAARVRVLSPEQLLDRLAQRLDLLKAGRGVDARQQTLRATIEWSHELLDADEQQLFVRLAVFAGGCTLEAAENVCDADIDTLQSLVDKSLVRVREGDRFWMLETIREYALERLEESGDADEMRRRHAQYFLGLAEEAEPEIKRGTPQRWLDRLAAEHDNLRAALDWLEAAGETQSLVQMAGALWSFWGVRGPRAEGSARLARALAADQRPTLARARALAGSAMLDMQAEDPAVLRRRVEDAMRIFEEQGDAWGTAYALMLLGDIPTLESDWEGALPILERSLELFRKVGDAHYVLALTRSVAWVHEEMGDIEGYRRLVEEYLRGARAVGNKRLEARGVGAMAMWKIEDGLLDEALPLMEESLAIDSDLGFTAFVAIDLVRFAAILVRQGRAVSATQLVALADRMCDEAAITHESWAQRERDDTVALIREQLDEAAYADARERGRTLSVDEALALTR